MTRKHYVQLASALNATRPDDNADVALKTQWNQITRSIGYAMGPFNPQFQWSKFERACGGLFITEGN